MLNHGNLHESARAIPALFVSHSVYLKTEGQLGGVQICTREYLDTLRAAGFEPNIVTYETDRRLSTRIRRFMWPRPYRDQLPPVLLTRVLQSVKEEPCYIFLNKVDLAPLARELRGKLGSRARIILLSHGLESVDYLHILRSAHDGHLSRVPPGMLLRLGRQLAEECEQRQYLDHVICLAPFEAEIERWLGARRVDWLPRTISARGLDWQPDPSRLGFVGTLDHPPNQEGLELFLEALARQAPPHVRLRLVGGPAATASALKRRFPLVDYLGPLSNEELVCEARTWSCFVHPLFCYARGCSTKLATALGWRIPVVTTPAGCRGYSWSQGKLSLANDPDEFAALALTLLDERQARIAAREVTAAADSSPTLTDVACQLRRCLMQVPSQD